MSPSERPGLRSAHAPSQVTEAVAAKAEFRSLCVELGLTLDNGTLCKRGAARYLSEQGYFDGTAKPSEHRESVVRGWVNPYALNRKPPERALAFLRRKVQQKRASGDGWTNDLALALEAIR